MERHKREDIFTEEGEVGQEAGEALTRREIHLGSA